MRAASETSNMTSKDNGTTNSKSAVQNISDKEVRFILELIILHNLHMKATRRALMQSCSIRSTGMNEFSEKIIPIRHPGYLDILQLSN